MTTQPCVCVHSFNHFPLFFLFFPFLLQETPNRILAAMSYPGYNDYYQQQQQQPYEYDASQIQQSYDQSYAAYQQYYAYNQQYAYYPDASQTHLQFQPESAPVHPPGVTPTAPEPVPAVAPTGPSQYRGRGGRSFRGGRGRGHFNSRGRGRHFSSHSSGPAISIVPGASSSFSEQTGAQVPAAPSKPPPRSYCCEICKVECNSPEILEQHKNGKKHKKTLKAHEELQRRNAIYEQRSGQVPSSQLNVTDQSKNVQESDKKECSTENMGPEIAADNHKEETELQNDVGKTSEEAPAQESEGKTRGTFARRGRGLKRKMRGGRGGKFKFSRTNDGSGPVEAVSFTCEVCNVKCESNVVYQSHLSGKKHLTNLVRVHGSQPSSGVGNQVLAGLGLQSMYPPDLNALLSTINAQVQQGDTDPQVLLAQLLMTVLTQAQVPGVAPQTGLVAAPTPALTSEAGPSHQPQLPQTQVSEIKVENPETKHQELKHPQDSSGMAPADISDAPTDQIPSECEAPKSQ